MLPNAEAFDKKLPNKELIDIQDKDIIVLNFKLVFILISFSKFPIISV